MVRELFFVFSLFSADVGTKCRFEGWIWCLGASSVNSSLPGMRRTGKRARPAIVALREVPMPPCSSCIQPSLLPVVRSVDEAHLRRVFSDVRG